MSVLSPTLTDALRILIEREIGACEAYEAQRPGRERDRARLLAAAAMDALDAVAVLSPGHPLVEVAHAVRIERYPTWPQARRLTP